MKTLLVAMTNGTEVNMMGNTISTITIGTKNKITYRSQELTRKRR